MIALILAAAGCGSRRNPNLPKQFETLQGMPLYLHSLDRFSPFVDLTVIVHPGGWKESIEKQITRLPYRPKLLLQEGGARRQDSVYLGLKHLRDRSETVLIHDAARPFVSSELIQSVIKTASEHGACVPVLPVTETLKQVEAGLIGRTVNRDEVKLAQTPQGFQTKLLIRAFRQAEKEGFYGTDDSQLVERLGISVWTVPGERDNIKITWPEDLQEPSR